MLGKDCVNFQINLHLVKIASRYNRKSLFLVGLFAVVSNHYHSTPIQSYRTQTEAKEIDRSSLENENREQILKYNICIKCNIYWNSSWNWLIPGGFSFFTFFYAFFSFCLVYIYLLSDDCRLVCIFFDMICFFARLRRFHSKAISNNVENNFFHKQKQFMEFKSDFNSMLFASRFFKIKFELWKMHFLHHFVI